MATKAKPVLDKEPKKTKEKKKVSAEKIAQIKKKTDEKAKQWAIKQKNKQLKNENIVKIRDLKSKLKQQNIDSRKYSKKILKGDVITTTTKEKPNLAKYDIELFNVKKSYISGDLETPVLKGLDLKITKGGFVVILGPSGCGKTTLLNLISGLDKATEGDVCVLGHNLSLMRDVDLTKLRRKYLGFVFQQYNLLTNLTARENAEVGGNLASKKSKLYTIDEIFETIGMTPQKHKYPHQLSGGEQQRVSIARALAKNPRILFGDEPTGALDEKMGRIVLKILLEINRKYKTTIILVTHNPFIAEIADIVCHVREGRIDEIKYNKERKSPDEIDWA